MRTSLLALVSTLATAMLVVACSTGAPDEAPDSGPAAAPNEVDTERPPASETTAATAPLRLAALREGRAYEGAPPVISHPIGLGTECLECHLDGSEGFDDPEMPPPTPHPELANCRMCHVYVNAADQFGENAYEPLRYPLGLRGNDVSPPLIPHPLVMRERCVVCHNHGETSAATWKADLNPPHSEAWNCRMCHVPSTIEAPGPRPGATPLPLGED
jgi:hypothetical protein